MARRKRRTKNRRDGARRLGWDAVCTQPNDWLALDAGYYYDAEAADHVVDFFRRYLRHTKAKWPGQPFEPLPWQETLLRRLFGWKRPDGTRRFRRGFIAVPKKNGKSTLLAAIGLYLLVADGEVGAEIYTCAKDREQAAIIWRESAAMARLSPAISRQVRPVQTTKRLVCDRTMSVFKALSADSTRQEGLNASGVLFDELHVQGTPDLWDAMYYATAAREEPLHLAISTAGFDRESVCYRVWQYAEKVQAGLIEDLEYFAVIYAAAAEDDWQDEATWWKANPSLGATMQIEEFRAEAKAAAADPLAENAFRRYRLNQWTQTSTRWLAREAWQSCGGAIDWPAVESGPCWAGLDLAAVCDLTALAVTWPVRRTAASEFDYYFRWWFWLPADGIEERERLQGVPYRRWAEQGLIALTPGEVTDFSFVLRDVTEIQKQHRLQEIAIDASFQGLQLAQDLTRAGCKMAEFPQTFRGYGGPTNEFYRAVLDRRLHHGDHAMLKWMADVVEIEQSAEGLWRPKKPDRKKGSYRIDGIVAALMALGTAQRHQEKISVYAHRGLRGM